MECEKLSFYLHDWVGGVGDEGVGVREMRGFSRWRGIAQIFPLEEQVYLRECGALVLVLPPAF